MAKLPPALAEFTSNFVGGGGDGAVTARERGSQNYTITRNFSRNVSLILKEDFV